MFKLIFFFILIPLRVYVPAFIKAMVTMVTKNNKETVQMLNNCLLLKLQS